MTALEFSVCPGATSPVGFYLLRSAPCIPRSLMDSVRGWSQIANICQQNMQPDKTALNICHACFRMCAATSVDTLNLHVDLLGDRTTSVSACADGLVKRLLLCTGDALCLRRPPKVLWHVLLHIMIVCTTWLFPCHSRWRKTSPSVEKLWACAVACRSLLWLSGQYNSGTARRVGQLLEPRFRWLLWRQIRPKDWGKQAMHATADELLHLQLLACSVQPHAGNLYGCHGMSPFVLYAWASRCSYYVGIASVERKQKRSTPGPACRWLEHMCGMFRTHTAESQKLRYKLMRRFRPEDTFFLVCRAGPEVRVRAMETLVIASRRPPCNVGRANTSRSSKVVPRQRNRPPKPFRPKPSNVGPFDSVEAELAVSNCLACRSPEPPSGLPQLNKPCDFESAYRLALRHLVAECGLLGPCDIYDPQHVSLLVHWLGRKNACIDWLLLEKKWKVKSGPATVVRFLGLLKGRRSHSLATRRLNSQLRLRKLPPIAGVSCAVPRMSCLNVFRRVLVRAVHSCSCWNDEEKSWLLSRIRLVPHGLKKHRSMCSAPLVSRQFCLEDMLSHDTDALVPCDAASHLVRVEKIWDVPIRPTVAEDNQVVRRAIRRCCHFLHIDHQIADIAAQDAVRSLCQDRCYMKEQHVWHATQNAYEDYTVDMSVNASEVLTPDDKDKKFMWKVPLLCYQWLLFKFAMLSPAWELSSLGLEDAEAWCQEVFRILLPTRLKAFLKIHKYTRIVPYYYGTVKSKCFTAGQTVGHICTKPAHSCLRKIVSFCKWPFRRRWRFIHRAWETVVRSMDTDEVWSLKDACHVMSSRMHVAGVSAGSCTCRRCGVEKPTSVALTADAGQFFEAVAPSQAISAAARCLSHCSTASGHTTVTVQKGPSRTSFLGGCAGNQDTWRFVVSFSELFLAFSACMFVGYVSLGRTIFRLKGLPIGGVLSKVATSIVLGEQEVAWQHSLRRRDALGFAATTPSWNREVARGRYVDDLLWVSGIYCVGCLHVAIQSCYSVPFDLCDFGQCVTWLDLRLHVAPISWSMKPRPWVLPPQWSSQPGFVHCFLAGRFARLDECMLSLEAWLDAAIAILHGFRSAGWSGHLVKRAIFLSTTKRPRVLRTCLLLACKMLWQ